MKRLCSLVLLLPVLLTFLATGCQESGVPTSSNTITKPMVLTAELVHEIETAWYKANKVQLDWYTDDQYRGMRYYGHFEGYEVLFYPTESVTDMFGELLVGEYFFQHSDTFDIFVYRNGKFLKLLDAYQSGVISEASVAAIYEVHKPFEIL